MLSLLPSVMNVFNIGFQEESHRCLASNVDKSVFSFAVKKPFSLKQKI